MLEIIAKIILCLIAAAILGFVIGWIFSSLVRNEKHQSQILAVREKFDEQKETINQLITELDAKDREMLILNEKLSTIEKEMLSDEMDNEDIELMKTKVSDLETENLLLLEQIKEQKLCEDENSELRERLTIIQKQKEELLQKVEELKEFETSYKENIHKIAELESQQKKDETILTEKKRKKKKKKKKKKNRDLNDTICKEKSIIPKKELKQIKESDDKITQIIKNLFSNEKDI